MAAEQQGEQAVKYRDAASTFVESSFLEGSGAFGIRRKSIVLDFSPFSCTMLNNLRISSGVLPLIMFATVLQPTSLNGPFSKTLPTSLRRLTAKT